MNVDYILILLHEFPYPVPAVEKVTFIKVNCPASRMNELGAILEKDKLMGIAAEEYGTFRGTKGWQVRESREAIKS